jgi:hypothetical protein
MPQLQTPARAKLATAERATAESQRQIGRARGIVLAACAAPANALGIYTDPRGVEATLLRAIDALRTAHAALTAHRTDWPLPADYGQAEREAAEEERRNNP